MKKSICISFFIRNISKTRIINIKKLKVLNKINRSVKIYEMNNIIEKLYKKQATLEGHTYPMSCMTLNENKLFSGSWDGTISVWAGTNTETDEEIATLEGHTGMVLCLTISENKLYSGSYDETIRIWNTETHELVATLRGHTNPVSCLTIHDNKLYSGSRFMDNTIHIWNIETYEEIDTLRGDISYMNCLTLHENKLYYGSQDKTICVWKI